LRFARLFLLSSAQNRAAAVSSIDQCVAGAVEAATDANRSARRLVIFKGTVIFASKARQPCF